MRKIVISLLFIISALFAQNPSKIIPPQEAFNVTMAERGGFIVVQIAMHEGVYLLSDKLSFALSKPKREDLTKSLSSAAPEIYKGQRVYWGVYEAAISPEFLGSLGISGKNELVVNYQGCAGGGVICYPPMSKTFTIDVPEKFKSEQSLVAEILRDKGFFGILISFLGFGLLLSLTPCTFPMFPILSSIIAKHSKVKMSAKRGFWLSFVYVFAMSLAYAIAGVLAGIFGANVQASLQTPLAIGIFGFCFVLLALSMFGLYKFQMPSSLQTKFSSISKTHSGVLGVALMGFASALIVGPCVAAPLAGALIYIGQSGDALLGGFALFVMSMGMGAPLLVLGLSAGKFLPKPGRWMDIVQRIFGFILLGVAIWLLSRILSANITLWLVSALAVAFGIFIFKSAHLKIAKTIGVCVMIYGVVLGFGAAFGGGSLNPAVNFKAEMKKLPLDFKSVKNSEQLDALISSADKPVMLEFTASWCAVCTEFEDKTLSQKSVQDRLGGFLLLKADVTKNSAEDRELMRRFGLYGPPAIVFFKNGRELKELQIVGFKNEAEFLAHLDRADAR